MSRRRVAALLAVLALAAGLLSACTKPLPFITMLANKTVVRVDPQRYCFDASHCHDGSDTQRVVRASGGTTILVDVPRVISAQRWVVSAYFEDSAGTPTAIPAASSALLTDSHTARVAVPSTLVGQTYVLSVQSTDGTQPTGVWGVLVQVVP